ncbi:DNA/RNA non-specific endonuclease [Cupriavidus sp. 30B13]|uniref:DNA/RNA non-specific endonuclease n=1 Tax=Cupriavidus sp. 30B13 TaxID=3384241 RepID=UPI003B902859
MAEAYANGASQTRLLLQSNPLTGVGVLSYDAKGALMEGRYGDAAQMAGGAATGFAVGAVAQKYGGYGLAFEDIGGPQYGPLASQRGAVNLRLVTPDEGVTSGVGGAPRVETRNGYTYSLDDLGRATRIEGELSSNPAQGRSPQAQLNAGGSYRLPGDEGGHFIGRRFDGPLEDFNHFAQDMNFNRGAYKSLENSWQRALDVGKSVYFDIKPSYTGPSLRPGSLDVFYKIDDVPYRKTFMNRPGGQ